jgi:hypothetical protein
MTYNVPDTVRIVNGMLAALPHSPVFLTPSMVGAVVAGIEMSVTPELAWTVGLATRTERKSDAASPSLSLFSLANSFEASLDCLFHRREAAAEPLRKLSLGRRWRRMGYGWVTAGLLD